MSVKKSQRAVLPGISDVQHRFRVGFSDRLAGLLDQFPSRGDAAEVAGVGADQLRRYLKGDAMPPFDVIMRLAAAKNVSLDWLAFDEVPDEAAELPADVAMIPVMGEASSGHGSYAFGEEVDGTLAFSKSWLARYVRAPIDRLAAVFNRGYSNEPDIRDGDVLIVERGVERIRDDAYYIFDEDGVRLVKRIELQLGGGIIVKATNPDHEPRTLSREEAIQVTVFGRVRLACGAV